jgi:hypothetical protein
MKSLTPWVSSGSDSGRPSLDQSGYAALWMLMVVAIVPLAAALLSYFGGLAVPQGRINKGALVLQQPPLSQWQLTDADGDVWQGQGQWQLLLVVPQCLQQCQRWQYLLGQIKTSLGRDRDRVQSQLVLPDQALASQRAQHLTSPRAKLIEPGVWLADPLGNLVLHYRLDQPPQDVVKDLKRLLKVSKVG